MALPLRVPDNYNTPLPAAYYDPERLEVYRTLNEARFASTVAANDEELPMYSLNPALRDFWETEARYKVLYGGRGSSKSHDAAGHAVFLAANYTVKILCARQFQNRISESVYTLIKDKINVSPYRNEFEILKTSIRHKRTGSEFLFYGIARNLEEIKSTEGVDILWLEEAHYLNQEQWEVIEPTIRKEGAQVWLIFNPDEYTDFVYQNFVVNPPADTVSREINWQDNPYLSITMLKVIYNYYKREPESARHVYGGEPKMGADKSIIPLKYIIAAVDAHLPKYRWNIPKDEHGIDLSGRALAQWKMEYINDPTCRVKWWPGWDMAGIHAVGYDVADDGDDKNALVEAWGNVVLHAEEWQGLEDQITQSAARVYNHAVVTNSQIVWDSIGVGAFVGSKFRELNEAQKRKIIYEPFNAGGEVMDKKGAYMVFPHVTITNGEHFSNIKAQMWDEIAVRFRKTYEALTFGTKHPVDELISLNSATLGKMIDKIKMELAAPHKSTDRMGKFKVESKDDLRDRGIKSPNVADALIMSLIRPKRAAATFF